MHDQFFPILLTFVLLTFLNRLQVALALILIRLIDFQYLTFQYYHLLCFQYPLGQFFPSHCLSLNKLRLDRN